MATREEMIKELEDIEEQKEMQAELDRRRATADPIEQRGLPGVKGAWTRFKLKNIIGDEPDLQVRALQESGLEAKKAPNGQIAWRKPGDKAWGVLDPNETEWQDISDVVKEGLESLFTGAAATAAGTAAGVAASPSVIAAPVAAIGAGTAAGAGAGALFEGARQWLGEQMGLRKESEGDLGKVGEAATYGAIGGLVPGGQVTAKTLTPAIKRGGKIAASKAIGPSSQQIKLMGFETLEEMGAVARDAKLTKIISTSRGNFDKVKSKIDELGYSLERQYDELDEWFLKSGRIPLKEKQLVKKFRTPLKEKEFESAAAVKDFNAIVKRMFKSAKAKPVGNKLMSKRRRAAELAEKGFDPERDFTPSTLWRLARALQKRAGTYTSNGGLTATPDQLTKAKQMYKMARSIRKDLAKIAQDAGMKNLKSDSATYFHFRNIKNALNDKTAAGYTHSAGLSALPMTEKFKYFWDVLNKLGGKVGKITENIESYVKKVPKAVRTGTEVAAAGLPPLAARIAEHGD